MKGFNAVEITAQALGDDGSVAAHLEELAVYLGCRSTGPLLAVGTLLTGSETMTVLSARLRLRPTRIALLVRPTERNRPAIRRFMRLSACLWGGRFNPIIPVCRIAPPCWRGDGGRAQACTGLSDAYIRFFEPDVFVEAESGLAAEAGIDPGPTYLEPGRVTPLGNFVHSEPSQGPDFKFGLSMFDLYRHLYRRELQFVPRQKRRVAIFKDGG